MKYIILFTLIIVTLFTLMKLSNYEERMDRINKYNCAIYGYQEDCKTPLPEEDRLK